MNIFCTNDARIGHMEAKIIDKFCFYLYNYVSKERIDYREVPVTKQSFQEVGFIKETLLISHQPL